ncbi:hypothetical protein EV702DRAFT_1203320 [Suillus placidus]|uniref:Uncharacterized protein n=1 Tax=Suillus placidus TaxID=48579 RepID=A0A9P6ZIX4_9AGAM|nr:hypothetical protein EV702DRAFT_1203320 [Suillus placidus]
MNQLVATQHLRRITSESQISPPQKDFDIDIKYPPMSQSDFPLNIAPKPTQKAVLNKLRTNLRFIQQQANAVPQAPVLPTITTIPIVTASTATTVTSMMTITPLPSFYGDYEKGEEPTDWFHQYRLSLPRSMAEVWVQNLAAMNKTTWTVFAAAFAQRWPPPVHVTLMLAQQKDHIRAIVLKEEDIRRMIEKDRGHKWGHVKWAKEIECTSQGFGDARCLLLDIVLENTPAILRDLLTEQYNAWPDFVTNILFQQQQQQLSHPAPPMQQTQPPPPQTPQQQMTYNPLSTATPMVRGNLFYGGQGFPQTPMRGRGAFAGDRARLAAQFSTLPQHPDTDAGHQAYAQHVQEWHSQHGATTMPNTDRPYLLKPGTSPMGSRECFACGVATAPLHQSSECSNEALPVQETPSSPPAGVQYVAPVNMSSTYYPPMPTYPIVPGYPDPNYYGQQFNDVYQIHHDAHGNGFGLQHPTSNQSSPLTTTDSLNDLSLLSVPTSASTSNFDSLSMPISPMTPETKSPYNLEEVDEGLVVPILEIEEIVSPSAASLMHSDSDLCTTLNPSSLATSSTSISLLSSTDFNASDLDSIPDSSLSSFINVDTEDPLSVPSLSAIQSADLYLGKANQNVIDLYNINDNTNTSIESKPFITQVLLYGPKGKTSCFQANVDDGAMVNAIDSKMFKRASDRLRRLIPSNCTLRMANGALVPSQGIWKGTLKWGSAFVLTSFEVFDSRGIWNMLIGKPLLEQISAVHDYALDQITLPLSSGPVIITNLYNTPTVPLKGKPAPSTKQAMTPAFNQAQSSTFLIATIPADATDIQKVSVDEQYVFELSP